MKTSTKPDVGLRKWEEESLCGGRVRLHPFDSLEAMLKEASLTMIARRGVRTVADYPPPQIPRSAECERIFALERKLGARPEFAAVARYVHCLARPITFLSKGVQ